MSDDYYLPLKKLDFQALWSFNISIAKVVSKCQRARDNAATKTDHALDRHFHVSNA